MILPSTSRKLLSIGAILALSIATSMVFWWGLWTGECLIGGDLYPYYIPQKVFLAEELQAGRLPMWNPLVGHGYPIIAESQTGICQPLNLIMYRLFSVNTAYNAVQLLHYILAFAFTFAYCRRISIGIAGSFFAALVYVYGWFPSRICLEWAIIGGAWLPLAFWSLEGYLGRREWKYLATMLAALSCQLLPGHFCLGFITQVALVIYFVCRMWQIRMMTATPSIIPQPKETPSDSSWKSYTVGFIIVLLSTYTLSAVQILPTWELKQISQRSDVDGVHEPGYGHCPVWYWSQAVQPWKWYLDPTFDLNSELSPGMPTTNKVEAHLYFGLTPIIAVFIGIVTRNLFRCSRFSWIWLLLGLLSLIYTPGWLLPITRHLPGFSFFIGPGRFGMVTTFAVAVLTGVMTDWFRSRIVGQLGSALVTVAILITVYDLYTVSRLVTYATIIPTSPLQFIEQSEVRAKLYDKRHETRVFSPGVNLPTILGITCTPVYFGMGPAEYYDPRLTFPDRYEPSGPARVEQIDWLRRAGVTHILSMQPITGIDWPCRLIWRGIDQFLNRAWGTGDELYLYELLDSRGRVEIQEPTHSSSAQIVSYAADRVEIHVQASRPAELVLVDLDYPGWVATIDGTPVETKRVDGMFRGVSVPAGQHDVIWSFRPRPVRIGAVISLLTIIVWSAAGHRRYHGSWMPKYLKSGNSH